MKLLSKILQDLIRLVRISREFIIGFHRFGNLGPTIAIFGSARLPETHPSYFQAEFLTEKLGREGFTILTGGGPSVMEAANRGARKAKARSIACNIVLPHEQRPNAYVDFVMTMKYFFTRKYMLLSYPSGFVIFPGGYGTLDEFFELITLIQTKKIQRRPVILVGTDYWAGMTEWLHGTVLAQKAIDPQSLELFTVTDDLELVFQTLKRAKEQIDYERQPHPINSEA